MDVTILRLQKKHSAFPACRACFTLGSDCASAAPLRSARPASTVAILLIAFVAKESIIGNLAQNAGQQF